MQEIWKEIPDYDGAYSVSNLGKVRSNARHTGRRNWGEKILKPGVDSRSGHLRVALYKDKKAKHIFVHYLVMLAFVGPRPAPEIDVCHFDGDPANNTLANLRYDTKSNNRLDDLRNGVNKQALVDKCPLGHFYFDWNNSKTTATPGGGKRTCKACGNARSHARNKGLVFSADMANFYYNKLKEENTQ